MAIAWVSAWQTLVQIAASLVTGSGIFATICALITAVTLAVDAVSWTNSR